MTTLFAVGLYASTQYLTRSSANDPELQLAKDAALALSAGTAPNSVVTTAPVDLSQSLSLFGIIVDGSYQPVLNTARLHDQAPLPPVGVFRHAIQTGQHMVTWQPEPGVRLALVLVPYHGRENGVVAFGRSLLETEARETQLLGLISALWLAGLCGSLVVSLWPTHKPKSL